MLFNELLNFKTKEVRDLAWAIFSPCIIKGDKVSSKGFSFSEPEIISWLNELDKLPEPLHFFIEKHKSAKRIGKYFEILLLYFFQNQKEIKNLYFSVQVKKSKELTLGEFDFLLQSRGNKSWIHLEVAVKFYLAKDKKISEKEIELQFIGPNAKDRLDLKLNKLYHKQMLLGDSEAGKTCLGDLGMPKVEQRLLVKGYLFYNFKHPPKSEIPEFVNEYGWKGWWSYFNEYPFAKQVQKRFVVLQKLEWLAPFVGTEDRVTDSFELQKEIKNKKIELPVLLVEVEFYNGVWQEINRGFLVENDWGI